MLLTFFSLLNPLGTVTARQDNSAGYAHRQGSVTELSMAAGKCCTQGVFIIYLRKVKYSQKPLYFLTTTGQSKTSTSEDLRLK